MHPVASLASPHKAVSYIKKLFISTTFGYGVTVKQHYIKFERREWSSWPLKAKTLVNKEVSAKNWYNIFKQITEYTVQ
jgi:hypothetical protein